MLVRLLEPEPDRPLSLLLIRSRFIINCPQEDLESFEVFRPVLYGRLLT